VPRPAVFLDRDGTINVRPPEHDYVRDPAQFRWLPGALQGMVALAEAGLPLIVGSNQRGVSRGLVSYETLEAIERGIQTALGEHGTAVEAFRYCPHAIEEHCDCRKPNPGLLVAAARDLQLDLPSSWMIGDSEDDVSAGRAAGCRTIRIADEPVPGERTAGSLSEAAAIVLGSRGTG
jgi:D-glycero-D-manno-heptose 1,7-bisphosphate phosphatase